MDYLPPELLTKIFTFLDTVSIIKCRQVCQRWRILTIKMVNPLYLPGVMVQVMQKFHQIGKLRDTLKLRLVCKLWKNGLDQLTMHDMLVLKGLTVINSDDMVEGLVHQWNPFPSGIVRMKLCYGHDDPENVDQLQENVGENAIMDRFSDYLRFLQVSLQHADCAEKHLTKVLNYPLKRLEGLVISESPSPYRFSQRKTEITEHSETMDVSNTVNNDRELGQLEKLRFLKLDDSDTKLRYSSLYMRILQNSPNLKHLEINGYHHLDMEIIKLLANRSPNKHSLTHLKMDAEDPNANEIMEVLNKSDFPLKYLSLKIQGFGTGAECSRCTSLLHSSLQKFGPTLERLELKLDGFRSPENPQPELQNVFPSSRFLKKLTRLKLVGYMGQLDFLAHLKSLKALMVVDFNPQSQKMFNSDQSFQDILPNLQTVYLPLQQTLYSADTTYKSKLQNFMYEGDASFIRKYCGLYQEIFP